MFKRLATALGFLAIVLVSTLAHAQSAAQAAQNDPDFKEVVAYQLTVPALNKVAQASKNIAATAKSDPRFAKQAELKAEIKKLEDKDERTDAEDARLDKLRAELEEAEDQTSVGDKANTLAEMAAAIEKEPVARKALADAGISAREFVKFGLAYFQAGMVAGMMKQGLIKEVPKELAATVNMENVKFVQEHEAELAALAAAMKAIEK